MEGKKIKNKETHKAHIDNVIVSVVIKEKTVCLLSSIL